MVNVASFFIVPLGLLERAAARSFTQSSYLFLKVKVITIAPPAQGRWWRSILISGVSSRQSFAPPAQGRRGRTFQKLGRSGGLVGWACRRLGDKYAGETPAVQ